VRADRRDVTRRARAAHHYVYVAFWIAFVIVPGVVFQALIAR
jgi:hypothetical protein